MSTDLALDSLSGADVDEAAALHMRAFPSYFLTSLGERFLRELYAAFASDPSAVTVIARSESGELSGVVVGTVEPRMFFRRLVGYRWFYLMLATIPMAVQRPRMVMRLVRGLGYRGGVPVDIGGALLSSICVEPAAEHGGVGRTLVRCWWLKVQERGIKSAYLSTDALSNRRVNEFYKRAGWRLAGCYMRTDGRRMNCYVITP